MPSQSANGTCYELVGSPDSPVIVLIHGLGLDRSTWTDYVPALAATGRVLTYDLFGHGDSAPAPEKPSLAVFATQLAELLTELHITHCIPVGFSLGGMINRRFAMDYPDRVTALVIMNSPHERDDYAQRLVEERALTSREGGPGATIDTTLERWFTPEFRTQNPEAVARVRRGVLANDPVIYADNRWVLAHGVRELVRPEPALDCPALVMTCENDSGSTPAMTLAIAAEISGSETHIVPGLRHLGLLEQPSLFLAPLCGFLDRQRSTPPGRD